MSRPARVPGTFRSTPTIALIGNEFRQVASAQSAVAPACKQCKEGSIVKRVLSPLTGRPHGQKVGNERVVRFMGAWACLDHYRITNTKKSAIELPDHLRDTKTDWSLVELFPNRAYRRRVGHLHGV